MSKTTRLPEPLPAGNAGSASLVPDVAPVVLPRGCTTGAVRGAVEGNVNDVREAPASESDAAAAPAPSGSTPIPPSRVTTVVTTAAPAAPSRR